MGLRNACGAGQDDSGPAAPIQNKGWMRDRPSEIVENGVGCALPVLNDLSSRSSGALPLSSRTARRQFKVGHVHHFHRLRLKEGGSILIATVAQGHVVPSTWASAYASLPTVEKPLVRDVHFEVGELEKYKLTYSHRGLDWLDSRFMLRLALEQCVADVRQYLGGGPGMQYFTAEPELIDSTDLHVLRVQGELPHLHQLMDHCRDHLLLYQDLRQVHDLPAPILGLR